MPVLEKQLPIIRPITDLRTKLNDVCAQATESQEPVVLTKNGVSAYVLMDSDAFQEMQRETRYRMALREAEIEERYNPNSMSAQESDKRMSEILAMWGLDYARA